MSMTPCDLHEVTNCGFCTGAAKKFDESIKESFSEVDTSVPLPKILGGVSIYARFAGNCDGCGRRYPQDTPIFRPTDNSTGWVVIECCV